MSDWENHLRQALRELSAAAPPGAPPELGARLRDAFARHHAHRKRTRIALAVGFAACLALSVSFAGWRNGNKSLPAAATKASVSTRPYGIKPAVQAPSSPPAAVVARAVKAKTGATSKRRTRPVAPPAIASTDFLALPSFDPAIPIGQVRILRLEMPGSALQLVGYPVNEELLQRRVVTDMLVGQDGLPYAVRLVQTRANH